MPRKNIIIPMQIWEIEELNVTERLLASVVYGYTQNGKPCFMTNTGFAKLLKVSKRTAQRAVNTLLEKGYLEALEGSQRRHLKCHGCLGGVDTSVQGGETPVSTRNNKLNRDFNNNLNKMNGEIRKEIRRPSTWQQVRDYFREISTDDRYDYSPHIMMWAKDFYSYYDSRGWKTKTGDITMWRPVALAWFRRSAVKVPQRAVQKPADLEALTRDLRWHQRRLENYEAAGKQDLVLREAKALAYVEQQIKQHGQ